MASRKTLYEFATHEQQALAKLILSFLDDNVIKSHPVIDKQDQDFFATNKKYIRELEQFLLANGGGAFVPLPSWDPSFPIPASFNLVKQSDKGDERLPLENTAPGFVKPKQFRGSGLLSYPSPEILGKFVRKWEVDLFNAIGGTLSEKKKASAAPIFWLTSAFIDDVYNEYQRAEGDDCCCCDCGDGDGGKCAGEIILFEHDNFHGRHKHVYRAEPNLNYWEDFFFNDKTSSIVVIEGNWELFVDANFIAPFSVVLGPGLYTLTYLNELGITNDSISSLRPTTSPANYNNHRLPPPVENHAILFTHINLHGSHKHVFTAEPNLNNSDEIPPFFGGGFDFGLPITHPFHPYNAYFNDRTSSVIVLMGLWTFYEHAGYVNQVGPALGVGVHLTVPNDIISSLRPVAADPTKQPKQIVLFEHRDFRGMHKHLFRDEPNLNQVIPDFDNFFNDRISSIAVRSGQWQCFEHANYTGIAYPPLNPGCYRWLENFGFRNDDISSVNLI